MKKSITFKIRGRIMYISNRIIYIDGIPIRYYKNIDCKAGDYVSCTGILNYTMFRKKDNTIGYKKQLILDHIHILKPINQKSFCDLFIPKMLVNKDKYYIIADCNGLDVLHPLEFKGLGLSQGYYENVQMREITITERIGVFVIEEHKALKALNAIPKEISDAEVRSLYDTTENLKIKLSKGK